MFQATIELLVKDLVWPALVSDIVSDFPIVTHSDTVVCVYISFVHRFE